MTPFIAKYPLTDALLAESLDFTECNMREIDADAREGYTYPDAPTPRQQHNFDWALEEIQFNAHLTHLWCVRNGRVV